MKVLFQPNRRAQVKAYSTVLYSYGGILPVNGHALYYCLNLCYSGRLCFNSWLIKLSNNMHYMGCHVRFIIQ